MTTLTASQLCNRQYTDAAIVELHQIADLPDRAEVAEAFASFVALDPAATLFDFLVALMRLGVSMSIVESALAHLPMSAD